MCQPQYISHCSFESSTDLNSRECKELVLLFLKVLCHLEINQMDTPRNGLHYHRSSYIWIFCSICWRMNFCLLHLTNPSPLIFHNLILRMLFGHTEPLLLAVLQQALYSHQYRSVFAVGHWSVTCLCGGSSRQLWSPRGHICILLPFALPVPRSVSHHNRHSRAFAMRFYN